MENKKIDINITEDFRICNIYNIISGEVDSKEGLAIEKKTNGYNGYYTIAFVRYYNERVCLEVEDTIMDLNKDEFVKLRTACAIARKIVEAQNGIFEED